VLVKDSNEARWTLGDSSEVETALIVRVNSSLESTRIGLGHCHPDDGAGVGPYVDEVADPTPDLMLLRNVAVRARWEALGIATPPSFCVLELSFAYCWDA